MALNCWPFAFPISSPYNSTWAPHKWNTVLLEVTFIPVLSRHTSTSLDPPPPAPRSCHNSCLLFIHQHHHHSNVKVLRVDSWCSPTSTLNSSVTLPAHLTTVKQLVTQAHHTPNMMITFEPCESKRDDWPENLTESVCYVFLLLQPHINSFNYAFSAQCMLYINVITHMLSSIHDTDHSTYFSDTPDCFRQYYTSCYVLFSADKALSLFYQWSYALHESMILLTKVLLLVQLFVFSLISLDGSSTYILCGCHTP